MPLAVVLLLVLLASPVSANWIPNGSPVTEYVSDSYRCAIAADGVGGAFVAWDGILGQHFTASGKYAAGWPSQGRIVGQDRLAPNSYCCAVDPILQADGEGGFYAVWPQPGEYCVAHCGGEPGAIHAVRRTSSGELAPGWPDTAVRVSTRLIGAHSSPLVVSNGKDGILIAWDNGGVQVQAVDARGERRWGVDGIHLAGPATVRSLPQIVTDEHGGAFVFWADSRGLAMGVRIFGQHLSEGGQPLWGSEGIPISDIYSSLAATSPAAVPDGAQGAIVLWIEGRDVPVALHGTRVTRAGTRPWGHDLSVSPRGPAPTAFLAASAPEGGALVAWYGWKDGTSEVRAQRIRHDGRLDWAPGGVLACAAPGRRGPLSLASAGDGGAFIAWGDSRPQFELYATRITAGGVVAPGWFADGSPVSARLPTACGPGWPGWLSTLQVVSVGQERAMVAWSDVRAVSEYYPCADQTQAMLLDADGPVAPPSLAGEASEPQSVASHALTSSDHSAQLRVSAPSTAVRDVNVRLALPEASPAKLELYDLAGRRLWALDVGKLGAGEHTVSLAGGTELPSGLYFLRLSQGARLATARIAVLR